jgi:hypothetical protein
MKRNQKVAAVATSLLAALTVLWAHGQTPQHLSASAFDAEHGRIDRAEPALASMSLPGVSLVSVRYGPDVN